MRVAQKIILGFIILEVIFAAVLFISYQSKSYLCLPGFDCAAVANSGYSSILGIKLSTLGIVAFPLLLLLYILSLRYRRLGEIFVAAAVLGSLAAAYFLYVQFVLIGKVCSSCLAIDTLAIIIGIASLYDWYTAK